MGSRRGHSVSVLEGQRRAVERLKASLFGSDPYVRSKYIQDYHREFRSFQERISLDQLLAACFRADIIFLGDYHALPSCQVFATKLLEHMAARARRVVLFVEMVYARDQGVLNRYLDGSIEEDRLRQAIRYDREWGYPWEGYGQLLRTAREAGIPVVAADAPPRGGLRVIRRRDHHAAQKVRERIEREPGAKALVVFGESHVARGHLPREVHTELKRTGLERSSIVIVQNVEEIYWKLAREGNMETDAVKIDPRRYAVFNASPLAKYEAYRQTLLRWSQQEDEAPDFLPSIHHLVDLLLRYLGLDPYKTGTGRSSNDRGPLVDSYPEVVTRRDRRRPRGSPARGPGRRAGRPGIVYRRARNRIDVYTFSIEAAGEAAARFLLAALGGRAGEVDDGAGNAIGPVRPGVRGRRARRSRWLMLGERILEAAFVSFAVQYLGPSSKVDPGRSGHRRARAQIRPDRARSLGGLVVEMTGRPRAGRSHASREWVAKAARSGTQLGQGVYARLVKGRNEKRIRTWLLEVARLHMVREGSFAGALERLLLQGSVEAGWSKSQKTRGGPP